MTRASVEVTASTTSGSSYDDVFLDYWLYWTSPVGPNSLHYMEFMLQLESSRCNSITGCPSDTFLVGSNDYQYFHYVRWIETGSWKTFTFSGGDFGNLLNTAFCNANFFGQCQWSLPHANGYIIGIDFGQEMVGGQASGSAVLDYNTMYDCPSLSPQGFIGASLSC
jgi:hypothetical protein